MNSYKISVRGIDFIKNEEGCKLKAYRDQVGVPTIGIGHTGPDVFMGKTITSAEALRLLDSDLDRFEACVNKCVTQPLTQQMFDACVSFAFNAGEGAFRGSTLLKVINKNPRDPDIRKQFNRWVFGTRNGEKVKLPVLVARREREANLYFS
ncbi:lysozyme [Spirosoma agri]|uniref:Lysozyme n=1 Tax=Spirosoma agri TaxID=1987381 RepID=A0A6M0IJ44_9BACT|nr:lysozyme [Spirosoma agri]NEU68289.1 lysozyme [Spirosoma agri]